LFSPHDSSSDELGNQHLGKEAEGSVDPRLSSF
jgi:hypothetical protein